MKKKFKKIASLVLAVVMAFAMAVPAMASGITPGEDKYSITVNASKYDTKHEHTYTAYQIFKGDLSLEDGKEILSNIDWGDDITESGQKAVIAAFADKEVTDLGSLVGYLGKNSGDSAVARKIAEALQAPDSVTGGTSITWTEGKYQTAAPVDAGYYLILDSGAGTGDAISDYIVQVVGNTDINPKVSAPSVDKQVEDNDNQDTAIVDSADGTYWGETADHEINESFRFKLKATIPAGDALKAYTSYKLVFEDTMSEGITYEGDGTVSVNVTIGGMSYELSGADISYSGNKLEVTIEDLLKATLSEGGAGAVAAAFGNSEIVVEVTYSAHLNENAVVTAPGGVAGDNFNKVVLHYSNNPNSNGTGDTTEDTVHVFTYDLPNKKVEGGSGEATELEGAEFRLYRSEKGEDEIKLAESSSEANTYYRAENQDTDGVLIVTKAGGVFNLKGLDAGTYWLEEVTAPTGYNKLTKRIKIEITADSHSEGAGTGTVENLKRTITGEDGEPKEVESGMFNQIENFKGATLPETGGIGTTIFYVVGSVLVLAAVVLLVTKRRMNSK